MVSERLEILTGDQPANASAFDRSGTYLAIASEDTNIYIHHVETGDDVVTLRGHEDSVQDLVFDHKGNFLVSGGSDNNFNIWS
jgi:WD40 repeat protein